MRLSVQAGSNRRQRAVGRLAPPFLCREVLTRALSWSGSAPRNGTSPVIYLDTSALVKLIRIEAESDALGDWLDERTEMRWITSALAEIELHRAVRAVAPEGLTAVPAVLARLDRFDIDPVIRATAAAYPDPTLRSLDAIHLATAQVAASAAPLTALVTYDGRLSGAAGALGINVAAPGDAS